MKTNKILTFILVFLCLLSILTSCHQETYKKDRRNRMTKRSRIANDFHARQAIKITGENLEKKEKKVAKKLKERERQQKIMISQAGKGKSKSQEKHEGKFAFY